MQSCPQDRRRRGNSSVPVYAGSTMNQQRTSGGLGTKLIAALVLAVVAWLLFKLVIGIVTGIATTLAVIVLVVAAIWAVTRF